MTDGLTPKAPVAPPPIYGEIARQAQIVGVNLMACSALLMDRRPGDVIDNLSLSFQFNLQRGPEPGVFSGFFGVETGCLSKGPETHQIATIGCVYAVKYYVKDADFFARLTDDDLLVFCAYGAPMNTWPYIREFVQATGQRLALPSMLVLPFLADRFDSAKAIEGARMARAEAERSKGQQQKAPTVPTIPPQSISAIGPDGRAFADAVLAGVAAELEDGAARGLADNLVAVMTRIAEKSPPPEEMAKIKDVIAASAGEIVKLGARIGAYSVLAAQESGAKIEAQKVPAAADVMDKEYKPI